jgi:hypothetical protein
MEHAGAILGWLYGNVMGQLDTGRVCPEHKGQQPERTRQRTPSHAARTPGTARTVSQEPDRRKGKLEILEIQNEMLLATGELLRNETARGILHSIELPKKSEYDDYLPLKTRESKSTLIHAYI